MLFGSVNDVVKRYGEVKNEVFRKFRSHFSSSSTIKNEVTQEINSSKLNQTLDNPLWFIYVLSVPTSVAIVLTIFPAVDDKDELTTEIAHASLGYFAVTSLSVMMFSLTVVGVLLGLLYPIDMKGVLFHLSAWVGVGSVIGFMSAAMTPVRFMWDLGPSAFSSDLFDGSVLLKLPAVFGVLGLLSGLCTAPCHLIAGSGRVKRRYVLPTIAFNVVVATIFLAFKWDPFSLGLRMSEKLLKQNSHVVYCIESAQSVERRALIRENIPVAVAKHILENKDDLLNCRRWGLLLVLVLSVLGMYRRMRNERNAESRQLSV